MPTVAIPFAPMPASQNPNMRSSRDPKEAYLRCAYVALASFGRWNPTWRRLFVTNEPLAEQWRQRFSTIDVEVEEVPFEHSPPVGFAPTFAGSLYLLDALSKIAIEDYLLLIDPDVITVAPLADLASDRKHILALPIAHEPLESINRLTVEGARELHDDLGEPRETLLHYGGELYGIPAELIAELRERVDKAWARTLVRFDAHETYMTTEEHVMSFGLAGMNVTDASAVAARIWTAHSFRTVRGNERDLRMWHLPSEKERGFTKLYHSAQDRTSWFWASDRTQFVRHAGRDVGLWQRGPVRLALDTAGWARARYVRRTQSHHGGPRLLLS